MDRTTVLVYPIASTPQEQVVLFAAVRRQLDLAPGMELRCVTKPEHVAGYHPGPDVIITPDFVVGATEPALPEGHEAMADTFAATGCDLIDVATFKERYPT